MPDRRLRTIPLILAWPIVCTLAAAPPEQAAWPASTDPATGPAAFQLVPAPAGARLLFTAGGRTVTADLPAAVAAFLVPLEGRVRLQDPWVIRPTAGGPAWDLFDGRPAAVVCAAPGVVRRVASDPALGPLVEVDHGSGLATRYRLSRHGRSAVPPGARVAAGEVVGLLGPGLPDDIPFVRFEVLFQPEPGRWASLDPAPFLFASAAHRALPIAASVLNAAVRAQDPAQVARLLDLGLDPSRRAADGTCPLEWAVMAGQAGLVRQLVAAGADPRAATAERTGTYLEGVGMTIANHGPTLLELAGESGDPDLAAAMAGR